ncbi:hypothetical protein HUJ04_011420 [Dendroctonus ponderosae]|nr:hypothetical protein HUJ04_011420 [Dendroctonus ponderosae]
MYMYVPYDHLDHLVVLQPEHTRCGQCHYGTTTRCHKCNVGLHPSMFSSRATSFQYILELPLTREQGIQILSASALKSNGISVSDVPRELRKVEDTLKLEIVLSEERPLFPIKILLNVSKEATLAIISQQIVAIFTCGDCKSPATTGVNIASQQYLWVVMLETAKHVLLSTSVFLHLKKNRIDSATDMSNRICFSSGMPVSLMKSIKGSRYFG